MNNDYYTKEALIKRYPRWQKQIEQGDFKVYLNKGCITIEWPNTAVFGPSGDEFDDVRHNEFSELEYEQSRILCGIISLIVSTSVQSKEA